MNPEEIRHEIQKLNLDDKLLLLGEVWDDIAKSNQSIPMQQWQQHELKKRLDAYHKGELQEFDWKGIQESLRKKYR